MKELTLSDLTQSAGAFVRQLSRQSIPELFGVTDGKAVGTYVEHAFHNYLGKTFAYTTGNTANGIDFPDPALNTDMKVTSIRQPQSSCPFRDAAQKVYGLGYHLLVFVYDKYDDAQARATRLAFPYCAFIHRDRTGDYQTTTGIRALLDRGANKDDIVAFLIERNLPLDEIGRDQLAERTLNERPNLGFLTVSNALQWRLQYGRIVDCIEKNSLPSGVENLLS